MAMRFEGSEGSKRSDIYAVDPTVIEIDESKLGRQFPVSDEAIDRLAANIKSVGQQQSITCRRLPDKRLQVVAGFSRLRAILKLHAEDQQWRINIRIVEMNEFDAFMVNVSENLHRNEVSPIDHAHNMRRMERDFGKTRVEIAKFFACTEANVSRLLALLSLPGHVQLKVSSGELTADSATKLGKLPEPEIKAALEAATAASDNGHVDTAEVTKQVRARGVKVGRTISDLRKVLKDRNEDVAVAILGFLKGDVDEIGLSEVLDRSHQYQEV